VKKVDPGDTTEDRAGLLGVWGKERGGKKYNPLGGKLWSFHAR